MLNLGVGPAGFGFSGGGGGGKNSTAPVASYPALTFFPQKV